MMRRDWRSDIWTDEDWERARRLADQAWPTSREPLYLYEALRAIGWVGQEREAERLAAEERWWWDWYCDIYPDLRETQKESGSLHSLGYGHGWKQDPEASA